MEEGQRREGDRVLEEALAAMDKALWRLATSWAGSVEDREDLRQAMLLKVWEGRSSFDGRSDPKTWIYRVAYRAGQDWSRASRRRRVREAPEVVEEGVEEGFAESLAEVLALREALGRLPSRQRELVVLRDLQGLSYQEIAEVLGIRLGSVQSGLHEGRRRLATLLGATAKGGA